MIVLTSRSYRGGMRTLKFTEPNSSLSFVIDRPRARVAFALCQRLAAVEQARDEFPCGNEHDAGRPAGNECEAGIVEGGHAATAIRRAAGAVDRNRTVNGNEGLS